MATHFEAEHKSTKISLGEDNRNDFYSVMKTIVVKIEVSFVNDEKHYSFGGGVLMSKDGLILSCSHIFQKEGHPYRGKEVDVIEFYTSDNANNKYEAELMDINLGMDLAILRYKKRSIEHIKFDFGKFSTKCSLGEGLETLCIQHSHEYEFSLNIGCIAYPDRSPGERLIIDIENDYMDKYVRILQLHGVHADTGASGCPVFDTRGRIIGIIIGKYDTSDIAVSLEVIRKYYQGFLKKEILPKFFPSLSKRKIWSLAKKKNKEKKRYQGCY